ncbi:MAG TPA: tetratricopeptide repeat protein [Bryobacteraceae bacterium]|nr:tetratricopeptide repeat protein [Bryobacteraceae bacterium]
MWTILLVTLLAQTPDFTAQGLKAMEDRQYDAAAALLTQAVAANPKDYAAHFNLALAYSLAGKDAQAIPEYKAVLELQPGLYQAQLNLGISLLAMKDSAAAIPYLKQAVAQKPSEFRPALYLGEAFLSESRYTEALPVYTTAITLDPNSAAAELGLGRAMARGGARKTAESHYRRAAAIDPSYKEFWMELATYYEENQERTEAIGLYREFPNNPGAQERMGVLMLETGDTAGAIRALEAAVSASPTPANRVALAQAYLKNQQPGWAEPQVAKALETTPQDSELRMFYGRLLRDQHKLPDAAREFSAVAQQHPENVQAWSELAGVEVSTEQYPEALATLDHVKTLHAEAAGHFFLRAVVLEHLRLRKEAVEAYNQFLATSAGKNPDQEFQARQRVRIIETELGKR